MNVSIEEGTKGAQVSLADLKQLAVDVVRQQVQPRIYTDHTDKLNSEIQNQPRIARINADKNDNS